MSEQQPVWYERDPTRLVIEQEAMRTRFPQFKLLRRGQQLYWIGTLTSNSGERYRIAVSYPDTYPDKPPLVFPIEPVIEIYKDETIGLLQHQFNDGSLCLYHPNDRFFERKSTAVTVIAVAAAWFAAYEYWLVSEKKIWPGKEAEHTQ